VRILGLEYGGVYSGGHSFPIASTQNEVSRWKKLIYKSIDATVEAFLARFWCHIFWSWSHSIISYLCIFGINFFTVELFCTKYHPPFLPENKIHIQIIVLLQETHVYTTRLSHLLLYMQGILCISQINMWCS